MVAVSLLWLISTVYSVLPFVGLPEVGNFAGLTALVALFVVVTAGCYIGTFAELDAKSARLNNHREARVAPANVPCQNPTEVPGQLPVVNGSFAKKEEREKAGRNNAYHSWHTCLLLPTWNIGVRVVATEERRNGT